MLWKTLVTEGDRLVLRRQRLVQIQHLLLDLVTAPDEDHTRYPFGMAKG